MAIWSIFHIATFKNKDEIDYCIWKTTMKKYLITGLGNFGPDYVGTRHNAGFMVVDVLAARAGAVWQSCRYGDMATIKVKNCELMLLKPSTFMNLSGVAVRYWMNKENFRLKICLWS